MWEGRTQWGPPGWCLKAQAAGRTPTVTGTLALRRGNTRDHSGGRCVSAEPDVRGGRLLAGAWEPWGPQVGMRELGQPEGAGLWWAGETSGLGFEDLPK